MFTKEDIISRMTNGESIEDIAAQITNVLNAANDEFTAQQSAKAKDARKLEIVNEINALVLEYANIVNPKVAEALNDDVDCGDMLIKTLDEMINMIAALQAFETKFEAITPEKPVSVKLTDDDEVLRNFIKKICE